MWCIPLSRLKGGLKLADGYNFAIHSDTPHRSNI